MAQYLFGKIGRQRVDPNPHSEQSPFTKFKPGMTVRAKKMKVTLATTTTNKNGVRKPCSDSKSS